MLDFVHFIEIVIFGVDALGVSGIFHGILP